MPKFLIILFLVLACEIYGQISTYNLYKDSIPFAKDHRLSDTFDIEQGSIIRRKRVIVNPTIDIYSDASKNGITPAFIICPGGGYSYLSYHYEGFMIAKWLDSLGIKGVILNSRLPDERICDTCHEVPLIDASQAIRLLKANAKEFKIDPNKIGIIGFSAGGHLAGSLATLSTDSLTKPNLLALIYPVVSMRIPQIHKGSKVNLIGNSPEETLISRFSLEEQVNEKTPPSFIVHSMDDKTVPVLNALKFIEALTKAKIENCESHIFPTGGHGYHLAKTRTGSVTNWPNYIENWLRSFGWVK